MDMKINRMMEIIIILLNRKTITSKELSERFDVSQRTIYRDIDELSSAGIPVYMTKGKGGGISLLENYTLNKAIFSDKERENIIFALKTLDASNQVQIDNTLEKMKSIFGNTDFVDWLEVDFSQWGNNVEEDIRFEKIKEATLNQKVLEFKYINSKNIKSHREVKPYKIMFKAQSWYLLGFCLEKKADRVFKITRMRDVKVTDISFERKELGKYFKKPERDYTFNTIILKFRVNSNMFYRIIEYYNEDQIVKESEATYLITAEYPYDEWIYSYILSYGDNIEIIEPEFVREEVKKRIKNMFGKYII